MIIDDKSKCLSSVSNLSQNFLQGTSSSDESKFDLWAPLKVSHFSKHKCVGIFSFFLFIGMLDERRFKRFCSFFNSLLLCWEYLLVRD